MKAISLWQPMAHFMAVGLKRYETRSWQTSYRGPLAIHAALRVMNRQESDLCEVVMRTQQKQDILAYGAVVGVVSLDEVAPAWMAREASSFSLLDWVLGDYSSSRYAWLARCAFKLPSPVRCVGRQGLFNLPTEVESNVIAQIRWRAQVER
jgi:hypothetical protein